MLGWALKRNQGGAKDASCPDDTQLDQPDTPAPVFAVRALKTALFGTPAPRSYQPVDDSSDTADKKPSATQPSDTPAKPAGILLTPGTGTTRRKRVSFGHDVMAGVHGAADRDAGLDPSSKETQNPRPKTRLTQALENSRNIKNSKPSSSALPAASASAPQPEPKDNAEDAWEDADEPDRDPDMTVDLNEPHSRSGKYWKSCFERYHADAKAEMEKLVKYKQLAKSYAKMKDSEAMDLNQKLAEEQERVRKMEEKVGEMARQINLSRQKGGSDSQPGSKRDREMVVELAKQTALAAEYREQVQELEEMLEAAGQEPDAEKKRRGKVTTSPRTTKTLIETQRELRRARTQVKELGELRDGVERLKRELLAERQKAGKLAEENRKLAGDLSRNSAKVVDLEKKLDESRSEARQKDRELRRLKSEHEQLKENAKSRFLEAEQVLAKKNEAISGLKDEIRSLTTEKSKSLASGEEKEAHFEPERKRYSVHGKKVRETVPEDDTTKILDSLEPRRRSSAANLLSKPQVSSNIHVDKDARHGENHKPKSYDDETLITSSRALRQRITAEVGKNGSSSSVLSDRANLQETRRTDSSNTSNRNAHPSKDTALSAVEPSLPTLPRIGKAEDDFSLRRKSSRGSIHRKASDIRPSSAGSEGPQIDLMQSHFARLGDTVNTSTTWDISTAKTSLPAERRAAAVARLQRKKAERARSERAGRNNENMLPA